MKKRHQKEKSAMHKQHCLVVDKIVITRDKKLTAIEKSKNKGLVAEYLSLNDSYLEGIYILHMWTYFLCKNLILQNDEITKVR